MVQLHGTPEITMPLTLEQAQTIVRVGLAHARAAGMKPLCLIVLDARAAVIASAMEDGASLGRFDIARAKASGALAFNLGSRKLEEMAIGRPHFFAGVAPVIAHGIIPVAGGVLIKESTGAVIGAVGCSGDTSDKDEEAATAGIVATGLLADGG